VTTPTLRLDGQALSVVGRAHVNVCLGTAGLENLRPAV